MPSGERRELEGGVWVATRSLARVLALVPADAELRDAETRRRFGVRQMGLLI